MLVAGARRLRKDSSIRRIVYPGFSGVLDYEKEKKIVPFDQGTHNYLCFSKEEEIM